MPKSTADILAGLAFLAVAAMFWVQFAGGDGVSYIFPASLILFLALGGVWFVLKGLWRRTRGEEAAAADKTGWRRVGIIAVLSLLYGLGIPTLGFFASTGLFLFVALYALNPQVPLGARVLRALVFAVVFSLAIWLGFVKMLNVPTPAGLLF